MSGSFLDLLGMGIQQERLPRAKKLRREILEMICVTSLGLLFFSWNKIIWHDQQVYTHERKLIAKKKDSGKLQWKRRQNAICKEREICIT
jgi:hypothetical protein